MKTKFPTKTEDSIWDAFKEEKYDEKSTEIKLHQMKLKDLQRFEP